MTYVTKDGNIAAASLGSTLNDSSEHMIHRIDGYHGKVIGPIEITVVGGAYHANDRISSNPDGLIILPNMAIANGRGGIITMMRVACNTKSVTPRIRWHFYNAIDPTLSADNANYSELYADSVKRVGFFDMDALSTAAGVAASDCSRAQNKDINLQYDCAAGSTTLYADLETLDAVTLGAGAKISLVVKTIRS